jgi:hypothetical protein
LNWKDPLKARSSYKTLFSIIKKIIKMFLDSPGMEQEHGTWAVPNRHSGTEGSCSGDESKSSGYEVTNTKGDGTSVAVLHLYDSFHQKCSKLGTVTTLGLKNK